MNFRTYRKAASMLLLILPVATALSVIGCGSDGTGSVETQTAAVKTSTVNARTINTNTVNTGTVSVTEADAGATVNLAVGATLEVKLNSNPSTGYHWIASVDQSCLQQSGEPVYTPDANSQEMIGSGGKDTFIFDAIGPGETSLLMNYLTPVNELSETSFSITVVVTA